MPLNMNDAMEPDTKKTTMYRRIAMDSFIDKISNMNNSISESTNVSMLIHIYV